MKKILTILTLLFMAGLTASAQSVGESNAARFSYLPYCFEAAPSVAGDAANSQSYDVCLKRTGANALKLTQGDLSTAANFTAGTLNLSGLATFAAGVVASGAVANDFSGSSGAFKPSTGTFTFQAAAVAASAGANNFDLSASSGTFKTPTGIGTYGGSANVFSGASPQVDLGVSGSVVGGLKFENATSGSVLLSPATGALGSGTQVLPTYAGALPTLLACGATGVGNQTCSPATANGKSQFYSGSSTLSSNAATITFPNAFTSSSTYFCVANDITTRANPVQMIPASSTTATITNTTGGSDVIQWVCGGN